MLHFLRKHQSYFFFVITIVIIASFSFFGTYDSLPNAAIRDQIVFTAVDGTNVKRSDLDEFVTFLNTDGEDKLLFGGAWGPNFLNNGVIKRDFLETGLAQALVAAYPDAVRPDLASRLEKEKRYAAYKHPQAPFISVENSWGMFAPDMKKSYIALKQSNDPVDPASFANRVKLYIAAQKFPASMIKRVLQYQEQQYQQIMPDPNLNRLDLSIFGYHSLEDWFGPRFTRLVSEFIINSSKIAVQKGYKVTREEALADLIRNAEISYRQNLNSPQLGVANSREYFNEQLRIMGMDQNTAIKIWTQVLLTERLFQDVGNAVFVDTLALNQIGKYANESVSGELYHLPKSLHLSNFNELQKFEAYLTAISKHTQNDKDLLALPTTVLSIDEISKKYPELIQKQYLLEIAEASKVNLQNKISLKDLWNWEVEDSNWKKLVAKFPELDSKKVKSRTERIDLLDNLDDKVRDQVDSFARSAIVDEHPEWLNNALASAQVNKTIMGITAKGGFSYFVGLKDRTELMQLLDKAPLANEKTSSSDAVAANEKLQKFTSDDDMYYRIKVLDRSPEKEIFTFEEANHRELLGDILNRQLENYYIQTRASNSEVYQNADKTWKEYSKVKAEVAKLYFEKLMKEIESDYVASGNDKPEPFDGNKAAQLRLYNHVQTITKKIKTDPKSEAQYLAVKQDTSDDKLPAVMPVTNQWKLEKNEYQTTRANSNKPGVDASDWFALKEGAWTKVYAPNNGDIFAYHILTKGISEDNAANMAKANHMQNIISNEAQRNYMASVIDELKTKNAISLDYLNAKEE